MHTYKWLVYKNEKIRIDKEIATLISNMWKLGIGTTSSCQASCNYSCLHKWETIAHKDGSIFSEKIKTEHCYNHVWIAFDCARSLEKFLNVVAVWEKDGLDSMYEHIQGYTKNSHPHDAWMITPYIENIGVSLRVERIPVTESDNLPKHRKTIGVYVEDGCRKNNFRMMPQLHFPRKHLSYVEQKFREALDK